MSNRQIIEVALFTAIAVILTIISIPMPIPMMAEVGLKIDISSVFIFLVFKRQGKEAGFISLLITVFLNEIIKGASPFFIGQIAYIIAFLTFYVSYRGNLVRGVLVTAILMSIFNFFVITPVYTYGYGGLPMPYFQWITSKEYIVMIASIYPLFNVMQWTINAFLIKIISND